MLPIVRTFISLPAGVARMPFWRFTALTLAGCIPWVLVLALIGEAVGDNWEEWRGQAALPRLRGRSPRSSSASSTCSIRRRRGGGPRRAPRAGAGERRSRGAPTAASRPARAVALGVVQGPAELLPVSSSAHIVLVPWLAGWDWDELDPELRKSFEVALHAGAAAALLIGQRQTDRRGAARLRRAAAALVLALSFLPAAVVGYTLERPIERRLGGPRATAFGLLAGAAAMLVADRGPSGAGAARPTAADGLALGVAQAAALAPGRLAQRRHPGRRPLAPLLPRPGEPALAHGRAADHRRRHRAQGRPAAPPRRRSRSCAARWPSASPPPSPRPSPRSG